MKAAHILMILGTVAVWGFNFITMRVALEVFSPIQMALVRSALTLLLLWPFWKPLTRIPWKLMAAALAIGGAAFPLLYAAVGLTESLTTVSVATQLMPVLSAVLAWMFFHEHVSTVKWTGIAIATAGAAYLAGATQSQLSVMAFGLTVLSVLFYAGGSIIIGKSHEAGVMRMLAWTAAMSLPVLGALAAVSGPILPDLGPMEARHWGSLFFLVVMGGLLGQASLFYLYRRYPVSQVAPWVLLIPLFVGLSSVWIYDEAITLTLVLGGGVVLLGVWIQQSAAGRKAPSAPAL